MKRKTQIKLNQLFVIILAWVFMGFVITVYDHLMLHVEVSQGPSEVYSFTVSAIRNMGAGLIGALIGGSILVFYVNDKFRDKPYGYTIFIVVFVFVAIVALITLIMAAIIVPMRTGFPLAHPSSTEALKIFLSDPYPIKSALVWIFIVAATQLLLQISSKFGYGVFWNIIRGKCNTPKEENRIFMFLDLDSSTKMAEKLGDEAYHALLKDFFEDITDPIINNMGMIYQYVGDEVVVAWDYGDDNENLHSVRCFFDMKSEIQKNKEKYMERYGLVPTFKAGIHCGRVVAGEVGVIKRDITYSGDVLNTTSRILGKCAEFGQELIVSSNLLSGIGLAKAFASKPLGAIKLRGKSEEVVLNGLKSLT
jgi:adenylate cyclase